MVGEGKVEIGFLSHMIAVMTTGEDGKQAIALIENKEARVLAQKLIDAADSFEAKNA